MKYFLLGLQNYAVFKGRSNRKEYWYFILFVSLIKIIALMLSSYVPILAFLILLCLICPELAVTVRRLHDVEFSGWLSLIVFIPFGWLVLLFVLFRKGDLEENKYGNPSFI